MKVAHLITQYFSGIGGLQVCLHNISQRHARRGVDVHVFHCDNSKREFISTYKLRRFFNFKLITKMYPFSKYLIKRYVHILQRKHRFDLWQVNGGYPYGALLADYFRENKIPCVLRCSGDDIQVNEIFRYGVRRHPKINRIITENYKKYSAVVALTETVKKECERIGVAAEKIKLIPNGVDIERIKSKPLSGQIRVKHNIPADSVILLSVGRNHPKKGYFLIPGILLRLLEQGLDAYWIVIGKGSSRLAGLEVLGSESGRVIRIEEISFDKGSYEIPSDDLIQYYKSSDLFVMLSMLETFGIVLVEAMAAGLPIVCFDAPGIRDVMTPECGIICEYNSAEQLAQAILNVTLEKDRRATAGRCLEHARQYSWDIIAEKYFILYDSLLSQQS